MTGLVTPVNSTFNRAEKPKEVNMSEDKEYSYDESVIEYAIDLGLSIELRPTVYSQEKYRIRGEYPVTPWLTADEMWWYLCGRDGERTAKK